MLMFQNSQDGSTCDDIAIIIGNMDEDLEARLTSIQKTVHELQATLREVQATTHSLWNELEKIDKETEHRISRLPNEIVHLPPLNAHEEGSLSQQSAPHQPLRGSSNRHSSFLAPNQTYVTSSVCQPNGNTQAQRHHLHPAKGTSPQEKVPPANYTTYNTGRMELSKQAVPSDICQGIEKIRPDSSEHQINPSQANYPNGTPNRESNLGDGNYIGLSNQYPSYLYYTPQLNQSSNNQRGMSAEYIYQYAGFITETLRQNTFAKIHRTTGKTKPQFIKNRMSQKQSRAQTRL